MDVIDEFLEQKSKSDDPKQKLDKVNAEIDEAMEKLEKQVLSFQQTVLERSNKQ